MDKFIQDVVKQAGDAVLKRFGKDTVNTKKSERLWDVVTKADLLSERTIISRIRKAYPTHGIIAEEGGNVDENAEYVWVIDPIDGTRNFASGIPMFAVMVSLVHRRSVILAAVYSPAIKELFYAKRGKGAFLNGRRIRCSSTRELSRTFGTGSSGLDPRSVRFLRNLINAAGGTHMMFSSFGTVAAEECYVACGRRDWVVSTAGRIWDFAPAYLLLKEAGCKVTDMQGRQWKLGANEMVAANPTLHKQLLKLTRNI